MPANETFTERGFEKRPGYPMSFHPVANRVRVNFAGAVVVDTSNAMRMEEDGHQPVYYFPRDEIRMELLTPTPHSSR